MPRSEAALQQWRSERKEQILRAAAEVFVRKGVAETKIADLAVAAGVSQGLLYHYFANKEEVFIALIERATHATIHHATSALEQPGTPWERLSWLTEQLLQHIREQPIYLHLLSQAPALFETVNSRLHEMGSVLGTVVHQLIVEGQAAGQVVQRDPIQLMLLYTCCIRGLAASRKDFGEMMLDHFPDAETILQLLKP